MIFIIDPNLPLEEGDLITPKLRSGTEELFEVTDRGYIEGQHGIESPFQAKVRRVRQRRQTLPAGQHDDPTHER